MTIGYDENNLLTFYNNNYTIDISHLEGCIVADWFGKLVYILDNIVHINNSRKEYDANNEHIYYIENVISVSILYDYVVCITPTSVFIIDNYIYSQVEYKYPNVTDVYCYNKSDLIYKADNRFYNHNVEYTMNIKHILVHFNIIYYADSNNIVHLFKDRRPLSHIKHFVIDDHDIYNATWYFFIVRPDGKIICITKFYLYPDNIITDGILTMMQYKDDYIILTNNFGAMKKNIGHIKRRVSIKSARNV